MSEFLDDLTNRGEAVIGELCVAEAEETLHLEFKTLEDASGDRLLKGDIRNLSEAICGFANAEGGVLLLGVATGRKGGLDFAQTPAPMPNVERPRNRIMAWLPEAMSPALSGLAAHLIPAAGGAGYIAIEVPPSDRRPHMSNTHHQYFRRGSGGTRVMEHGEVRDLFFAAREAVLEFKPSIVGVGIVDSAPRQAQLSLGLQNTGRVAAKDVFMRVWREDPSLPQPHFRGNTTERPRNDGSKMFTLTAGGILHVDDVEEMAYLELAIGPILPPTGPPWFLSTVRQALLSFARLA